MQPSRRDFIRRGSLLVPATAAGAALISVPKVAKADMWGNLHSVQWGNIQWGSQCDCLVGNSPPAVNLDMSGQNGQPYWANLVNMDALWGSYFSWANVPQVLGDGWTLPNFIENPYQMYPSSTPGIDNAINQAAWQYGVQVDPKYTPPWWAGGYGAPWYMTVSAISWISGNFGYPYMSWSDSWDTMVNVANQRAQNYPLQAIRNQWLVVGGLAILLTGAAAIFMLPGPIGFGAGAAMIGIGLAFIKLGYA
jgi:hypothetical protein